eukprot:7377237-Prymnesium_polylepis.2
MRTGHGASPPVADGAVCRCTSPGVSCRHQSCQACSRRRTWRTPYEWPLVDHWLDGLDREGTRQCASEGAHVRSHQSWRRCGKVGQSCRARDCYCGRRSPAHSRPLQISEAGGAPCHARPIRQQIRAICVAC